MDDFNRCLIVRRGEVVNSLSDDASVGGGCGMSAVGGGGDEEFNGAPGGKRRG